MTRLKGLPLAMDGLYEMQFLLPACHRLSSDRPVSFYKGLNMADNFPSLKQPILLRDVLSYASSCVETLDILNDPETMEQLRQSQADINAGRVTNIRDLGDLD